MNNIIVQNIIEDALILMKEMRRGQTASPEDLQNGVNVLNGMLDSWSVERLNLFTVKPLDCVLVVGKQDYTIGPSGGATYTNERPILIESAQLIFA